MDFFHVSYLLSKACLSELNQNFRRIYFSIDNEKIKIQFILEEKNQSDYGKFEIEYSHNKPEKMEEVITGDEINLIF